MKFLRLAAAVFALNLVASPLCVVAADLPGAPSTTVATQGGVSVTIEDLDGFAASIPASQRPGFFDSPTRIQNLITQLLVQKQLAAKAHAEGLDKNPLVQKQVALAGEDALGKARMAQFRKDIKLPNFEQLAKEDYIANKQKYLVRGQVDVKHVLIDTKNRSEAEAQALAETVRKEAVAHPDQFDALVEKYSDDPSKADNQGLMVRADDDKKYVADFAKAAAALKAPGDVSPVVKTKYGFHVLKLVSRTQDTTPAFAQIKDTIIAKLRGDYIEKQVTNEADGMRNLPMDASPQLVGSLRERYSGAAPAAAPAATP